MRRALPRALASLRALPGLSEALIVSTCNRTEIYCVGGGAEPVAAWLVAESGGNRALADCLYRIEGRGRRAPRCSPSPPASTR